MMMMNDPKTHRSAGVRIASRANSSSDVICPICCLSQDFFCVGACGHAVCFECGIRMRVLCEHQECSICRATLSEIYMVSQPLLPDRKSLSSFIRTADGNKFGIRFENQDAVRAYNDILAHYCTLCKELEFRSFDDLERHMRRKHELFYCDLCVRELRLFPIERKYYNRQDLAKHRRVGDDDDRSYRGHPPCQFCDERFIDEDRLYRHLRMEHFFCHFCDADGDNKFYDQYEQLREHFKEKHYICEIGNCLTDRFTGVFRTDIDLKAHQTTTHGKKNQKVNVIDIEFSNPANSNYRGRGRGGGRGGGFRGGRGGRQQPADSDTIANSSMVVDLLMPVAAPGSNPNSKIQTLVRVPTAPSDLRNSASATGPSAPVPDLSREFPRLDGQTGAVCSNVAPVPSVYSSKRIGSFDLHQFPALTTKNNGPAAATASTAKSKKTDKPKQTIEHAVEQRATFCVIDDDITHGVSAAAVAAAARVSSAVREPSPVSPPALPSPPPSDPPSLFQTIASGVWANRPISFATAGASLTSNEQHFPLLSQNASGSATAAAAVCKSSTSSNPWSAKVATSSPGAGNQIVSATVPKNAKINSSLKKSGSVTADVSIASTPSMVALAPAGSAQPKARRRAPPIKKENDKIVAEDFPALSSVNSDGHEPPPGLETINPPPGLEPTTTMSSVIRTPLTETNTNAPPPPGLTGDQSNNNNHKVDANGIETRGAYVRPTCFEQRNASLFHWLQSCLRPDDVAEFKRLSKEFRGGRVSAADYYNQISGLIPRRHFGQLFGELICLLPNVHKQRQLLDVHQLEIMNDDDAPKTQTNRKSAWGDKMGAAGTNQPSELRHVIGDFWECLLCGQIVGVTDLLHHVGAHKVGDEFPALT